MSGSAAAREGVTLGNKPSLNKPLMKPLVFALLAGVLGSLSAQPLTFHRLYGGPAGSDDVRGIAPAADGDLVFTGLRQSGEDPRGDLYLTRVNAAGAERWSYAYGRAEEDGGNHVLATSDGGFLLAGHTALSYGENCDGYLVKTSADGQEQWRAVIGTAYDDVCDASLELEDGSFLVVGRTQNAVTRQFNVLLAHLDPAGRQLSFRALAGEGPSIGYRLARAADGNLLLAGYCHALNAGGRETMLVLKCDLAGQILWRWHYGPGDGSDARAYAVVPLSDGSCLAVGGAKTPDGRELQGIAMYIAADGRMARPAAAGDAGYFYDAALTADGDVVLTGVRTASGERKPYLLSIAPGTNTVRSEYTADWPGDYRARCVWAQGAGDLALGGEQALPGGQADGFVARLAPPGLPGRDVALEPLLLFPNPFEDYTYLKLSAPAQRKALSLRSPSGQEVRRATFDGDEFFLHRDGLPPGVYFLSVRGKDGQLLTAGRVVVSPEGF